jgi:hypothetical protein
MLQRTLSTEGSTVRAIQARAGASMTRAFTRRTRDIIMAGADHRGKADFEVEVSNDIMTLDETRQRQ